MSQYPIILIPPTIAQIQAECLQLEKLVQETSSSNSQSTTEKQPSKPQYPVIGGAFLLILLPIMFNKVLAGVGIGLAILWLIVILILLYFHSLNQSNQQRHQTFDVNKHYYKKYKNQLEERRCRIFELIKQTTRVDKVKESKKGKSEEILLSRLEYYFPKKVYPDLAIVRPGYDHPYCPDISYIDSNLGLHIDVEVDEPYRLKDGQPVHYINLKKDDIRNWFFLEKGWLVIRFSEEQVVLYTDSCCKTVAVTIADLTGDDSVLAPFAKVPSLKPLPRWTWDEAKQMAMDRVRYKYQYFPKGEE